MPFSLQSAPTHPVHKAAPPALMLIVLSFFGIADAAYIATAAIENSALSCSVSGLDGCNIVAQSVYSHLFGIPLADYGVLFYGLIFVLAAAYLVLGHAHMARALRVLGILGIVASILFMAIQFILIKALCIYCLGSAIVSLLLFLATQFLPKHVQAPVVG